MQRSLSILAAVIGAVTFLFCSGCSVTTLQLQDYATSSVINIVAQAIVTAVASSVGGF